MTAYECSICRKRVEYEGALPKLFPFCGERCRMVDLGKWFRGHYSIDSELREEDLPDKSEHKTEG